MRIRCTALAVCLAFLLAACGKSTIKPVPADSILGPEEAQAQITETDGKESLPALPETVITPDAPSEKICIILPSLTGQSAVMCEKLENAAEKAGVEAVIRSSERDLALQQAAFDEALQMKASLIICDNLDDQVTTASVSQAKAAGIPVFLVNRGIDTLGLANAQILTDNFSCVRELGEEFISCKKDRSVYVELDGAGGAYDITEAFGVALAGHRDMVLARSAICDEYDKDRSYDLIWEMLHDTPEADALVCYNTTQTRAGLEAAADLGMTLTVVCLNGDEDEIMSLIDTGKVFASVVKPGAELADKVIELVTSYLTGKSMPGSECVYVRGKIMIADPDAVRQDASDTEDAEDPEKENDPSEEDAEYPEEDTDAGETDYEDEYYEEDADHEGGYYEEDDGPFPEEENTEEYGPGADEEDEE